jgi:lycopene beta-cyclase
VLRRIPVVDLVLVGGGLANGLIAWRLARRRPEIHVLVLETAHELGGNHTWCFHDDDLTSHQHLWIGELLAHRWDAYDVTFPGFSRTIGSGYNAITSERFRERISAVLGDRIRYDAAVSEVAPNAVQLASGETIEAAAVIDGRGARPSRHMALGFQKFLGQELALERPHGLDRPLVMDARVAQADGYRFVYVLPLAPDRVLVEDTYYADGPALDASALRTRIASYAADRGWRVRRVVREEHGVLPITLAGDVAAFWDEAHGVSRSGLAGGFFHPTTGYSLPDAARLADLVAGLDDLSAPALFAALRAYAQSQWRARRFYRGLNRMLFLAARPDQRYRILRRFYGLPEPLIRRFYAAETTALDKMRILTGKPPVSIVPALRALAARDLQESAQ